MIDENANAMVGGAPNKNAEHTGAALPEKPLTVIEARRHILNLGEIWQYRDLLYILTLRDIKVRYKQTTLGVLWAVIQPLMMMAIFSFFFGKIAGIPSDGQPYAVFAFAGLVPWIFFANAVNTSGNSLIGNSSMITKVYFPRMIIPMAAVGACLVDFVFSLLLLGLLMIYFGIGVSVNLLMLPALVLLTAMLSTGVGMWASAINVKYRDVRHALPFFIQVLMFATPIIYPLNLMPESLRPLFLLNPMAGLIEGFRSAIFGSPFDLKILSVSVFIILAVFTFSAYFFRRMERSFADLI